MALISAGQPSSLTLTHQKDGPVRQIASEATTVRFRLRAYPMTVTTRIKVEGDAVLDARRDAQAVTAYVLSPTLPTSPT
jgi:hypothetical protein